MGGNGTKERAYGEREGVEGTLIRVMSGRDFQPTRNWAALLPGHSTNVQDRVEAATNTALLAWCTGGAKTKVTFKPVRPAVILPKNRREVLRCALSSKVPCSFVNEIELYSKHHQSRSACRKAP